MHDAIGLQIISDRLNQECDIINRISELFPQTSSIENFHATGGINIAGYTELRWKYHRDRILCVRWEGLFLAIRQKLIVGDEELGISFPVTWGDETTPVPFNGNGEAMLPKGVSRDFWHKVIGMHGLHTD